MDRTVDRAVQMLVIVFLSLSLSGCFGQATLLPSSGPLVESRVTGEGSDKILLMDISGALTSAKPAGFADQLMNRPSLPARVKEELTKAGDDPDIKALVLRINSPGGTVTASDIVYHEIETFKETHKIPVIASMMDLGTSGAYYIAMASDRIIAHPSTVTGSIGVIMLMVNAEGLLETVGIQPTALVSGAKKGMGTPFRAMTDDERAIFQSVIDSMYGQFTEVVNKGRPALRMEEIRALADGRIYTAAQAKEAGLVDEIGYLDDTIARARELAGLEQATVVTYHQAGGYKSNIYAQAASRESLMTMFGPLQTSPFLRLLHGGAQFLYMWMP